MAGTAPSPLPAVPLTATVADCHSDHGPATLPAVDARTRQRINHPSFNLPAVTTGDCTQHVISAEHEPLDTAPAPDQINPEPCPAADGSCSTSVSSRNDRDSGSAP
ncbi:hypothetical protein ACFQYP_33785 [Nonomuraea antimicrobica]